MELLFQKKINHKSILGSNNEKSSNTPSVKKKRKSYKRKGFKILVNPSSTLYDNYTIGSKRKTLFLMFVIYVIFGVVFYNLLKS